MNTISLMPIGAQIDRLYPMGSMSSKKRANIISKLKAQFKKMDYKAIFYETSFFLPYYSWESGMYHRVHMLKNNLPLLNVDANRCVDIENNTNNDLARRVMMDTIICTHTHFWISVIKKGKIAFNYTLCRTSLLRVSALRVNLPLVIALLDEGADPDCSSPLSAIAGVLPTFDGGNQSYADPEDQFKIAQALIRKGAAVLGRFQGRQIIRERGYSLIELAKGDDVIWPEKMPRSVTCHKVNAQLVALFEKQIELRILFNNSIVHILSGQMKCPDSPLSLLPKELMDKIFSMIKELIREDVNPGSQ
jgi:hypothetical protein